MSTPVRWLGIDPSIAAFGVAVMEQAPDGKPRLLECGTWCTKPDKSLGRFADTARRIDELVEELLDLVERVRPRVVFIEAPALVPGNGVISAVMSARTRGAVDGACKARGLPVHEFGPQAVKRVLCGSPSAEKSQVATAVWRIYGVHHRSEHDSRPPDENATDAAAVAHVGSMHEAVKYFLASEAA